MKTNNTRYCIDMVREDKSQKSWKERLKKNLPYLKNDNIKWLKR